jgi:hypothetical protein
MLERATCALAAQIADPANPSFEGPPHPLLCGISFSLVCRVVVRIQGV